MIIYPYKNLIKDITSTSHIKKENSEVNLPKVNTASKGGATV